MRYIVSVHVENDNTQRLRGFRGLAAAKRYVERLGERLSDLNDAGKTHLFLVAGEVYRFAPSGAVRLVAYFDGLDRGDGFWAGWLDDPSMAALAASR